VTGTRWIRPAVVATALSAAVVAAIWLFAGPRSGREDALTPALSQREREEADREWELNRALRLLIERHGASQELGPFRWVLSAGSIGTLRPSAEDVPPTSGALALRAIEAAAVAGVPRPAAHGEGSEHPAPTSSPAQGLAFLLAVRESFPQGHPLRMRADAAIVRRQAAERK
jgi:hypothetical protein